MIEQDGFDRTTWTGTAGTVSDLAFAVHAYVSPISIALIGTAVLIYATLDLWTGWVRNKFDRLPPWSIYRMWNGIGFMLALAGFSEAGEQVNKSVWRMQNQSSPWLRERLSAIHDWLSEVNIGEAMERAGHDFPDRGLIGELRAYADQKGFAAMLTKISYQMAEETERRIGGAAKVLNGATMLLVFLSIALLMLGLFDLNSQMSNHMSSVSSGF